MTRNKTKIVKGKPKLEFGRARICGFQIIHKPTLTLTLMEDKKMILKIEMGMSGDVINSMDLDYNDHMIRKLDIYDPANKEFIHFLRELYLFHDCKLEDFADSNGIMVNFDLNMVESYIYSLSELELELEISKNEFRFFITNLKEKNQDLKEDLYKIYFYENGGWDAN